MYVISECSPEDLSSDRVHFLHQMCDFFVDHSVSHPVHMVEERGHCDGYRAAVDCGEHRAVNKYQFVGLHGIERFKRVSVTVLGI